MSEKLSKTIERINLSEVSVGQAIIVRTGKGDHSFTYTFRVDKPGTCPICFLKETDSTDTVTAGGDFILEGTGKWTTREQNPVQTQMHAFSIDFGALNVGDFLTGRIGDGADSRIVFDYPGQEVNSLEIE